MRIKNKSNNYSELLLLLLVVKFSVHSNVHVFCITYDLNLTFFWVLFEFLTIAKPLQFHTAG